MPYQSLSRGISSGVPLFCESDLPLAGTELSQMTLCSFLQPWGEWPRVCFQWGEQALVHCLQLYRICCQAVPACLSGVLSACLRHTVLSQRRAV